MARDALPSMGRGGGEASAPPKALEPEAGFDASGGGLAWRLKLYKGLAWRPVPPRARQRAGGPLEAGRGRRAQLLMLN